MYKVPSGVVTGRAARIIAVPAHGRFVAVRSENRLGLVDALGTAPEQSLPWSGLDLAFVGDLLWLLDEDGVRCVSPVDLRVVASGSETGEVLVASRGRNASTAVVDGDAGRRLISQRGDQLTSISIPLARELRLLAVHGRRILATGPGRVALFDADRELWHTALPAGTSLGGAFLFDGRAVCIQLRCDDRDLHLVLRSSGGERIHQIEAPASAAIAIAPTRGLAVVASGGDLTRIDLRYGRVLDSMPAPVEVIDLAIDDDARFLVAAAPTSDSGQPHVVHMLLNELFASSGSQLGAAPPTEPVGEVAHSLTSHDSGTNGTRVTPSIDAETTTVDAADGEVCEPPPTTVEIPDLLPLALGAPAPVQARNTVPDDAFFTPRQHLDALLDLIAARTALAIANTWNSGRLSGPGDSKRPFEREVNALLGESGGFAPDRLAAAATRLQALTATIGQRTKNSMAAGMRLPFVALTREFKLSVVASQVMLTAMAPALRGEIARLYSVLSNDLSRPLCDPHLIELIIAGDSSDTRDQIARELAPDATLIRHGLVRLGAAPDATLFAPITIDNAVLERMRGHRAGGLEDVAMRRTSTARLDELHVSRPMLRDLVIALAQPRAADAPLRLVLRGRRGSGRHTLIAALAARVGRDITAIDCGRLPRAPRLYAAALRSELFRALIRGVVPVLSELELLDPTDAEARDAVRQVLHSHPGPVVIRTSPEASLAIEPGFQNFVLAPLTETERIEVWRGALIRYDLEVADVDVLAARYRLGPGVIHKVVTQVASQDGAAEEDAGAVLEQAASQHIAARLEHVATKIDRRASWDQIALPDDMLDSLREFVGRAKHRRMVYEEWGYDRTMTTSRGLTALFYGPPGTGKSMVAGVIASELGLDLYRVDLARVVSKWVGETEKNLAEVFDGADDGQVMILFDEADSLFARRTDVKTANDRYANLEVNYLLQRLDTFEGVAVLTTNLEGAIDQAFKRRLSLRLYFPLPDEEMRARLWAAHVTPRTPTSGGFDFVDLARRFPLSGGYIRNCTLRAAFLAAQDQKPMTQDHLMRAIHLEYRELGKLSSSGRME